MLHIDSLELTQMHDRNLSFLTQQEVKDLHTLDQDKPLLFSKVLMYLCTGLRKRADFLGVVLEV